MTASNYKYTSDAGTVYQVTLPDDFALALGQTAASGSEPYLDTTISPRFANYLSASGIQRSAVIDTTAHFGTLGTTLTVSSIVYSRISAKGETIAALLSPLLQVALNLPGATGATGAAGTPGTGLPLTLVQNDITADVTMTTGGTQYTANSITLSVGTWIVLATFEIVIAGGPSDYVDMLLDGATHSSTSTMYNIFANEPRAGMLFSTAVVPSGTTTINLKATGQANGCVIKWSNRAGNAYSTRMIGIKTG